ncbi:MAG: hypothetical protein DWQ02_07935 [Bacteroidetes bacterium]|nr:MAG: hypothetical protein DWQ02_07935 [Bacteroidota bacterium]
MKYISAILLVFVVIFSSGCKQQETPVTEPTIFEDYFIRYLSQEKQLKAQAVFGIGDMVTTATAFVPVGGAAFMSSGMEMRKISDDLVRYTQEMNTEYQKSFRFRYKNTLGQANNYEISMTPVQDFFIQSEVSKSNGLDLVINGGLLAEGETLVFIFSDQNSVAASFDINGPTKDISYHLPPEAIKNLTPGAGKLYIVKKTNKNESLDHREIHAEIEFYTNDLDIEIVE